MNIFSNSAGEAYHTLWMCVKGDAFVFWGTILFCGLNCLGYLFISIRAWKDIKDSPDRVNTQQILFFILVFIFCGLVGYAMTILEGWFPIQKIRMLLGFILTACTWGFVISSRNGIFSSYNTTVYKLRTELERAVEIREKEIEVHKAQIKKYKAEIKLLTDNG